MSGPPELTREHLLLTFIERLFENDEKLCNDLVSKVSAIIDDLIASGGFDVKDWMRGQTGICGPTYACGVADVALRGLSDREREDVIGPYILQQCKHYRELLWRKSETETEEPKTAHG